MRARRIDAHGRARSRYPRIALPAPAEETA
jgi:hypothetical protein